MVHVYLVVPHLDGPSLSSQCRPPHLWPLALVHGPLPLSIPCDSQADAARDGVAERLIEPVLRGGAFGDMRPVEVERKLARRVSRHLYDLERGVVRRVSAADIKGFRNGVSALEQEAHYRTRVKRR